MWLKIYFQYFFVIIIKFDKKSHPSKASAEHRDTGVDMKMKSGREVGEGEEDSCVSDSRVLS
jgi:hypothetical protein